MTMFELQGIKLFHLIKYLNYIELKVPTSELIYILTVPYIESNN